MQIRSLIAAILLAAVPSIALAQGKPVKIGVLNDQSSVYADSQGIGSVIAARLAVEDYAKNLGLTVEVVYADHQNKVDIGAGIARDWYCANRSCLSRALVSVTMANSQLTASATGQPF